MTSIGVSMTWIFVLAPTAVASLYVTYAMFRQKEPVVEDDIDRAAQQLRG